MTLHPYQDGKLRAPLAIDLCSGLGGWAEGLEAEGWDVIRVDIEDMFAATGTPKPPNCLLLLQNILTFHGSQAKGAHLIVASPPCQEYSYMSMPWTRAKAKAAAIRADDTGTELERLNALFNACFRIQREACEAAGRHIPMVVENVRGAIPWVGRSRWNFGSYHLWGDVPALMPPVSRAGTKVGGMGWYPPDDPRHQVGAAFNPAAQGRAFAETREGRKVPGFRFDGSGRSFQTASVAEHVKVTAHLNQRDGHSHTRHLTNQAEHNVADGRKGAGAAWFDANLCQLSSKSNSRKAASAKIAKIPEVLARHIARTFKPLAEIAA